MKNETSTPTSFRPFRAGRRVDLFLGLKPQAESYSPFGTKLDSSPKGTKAHVSGKNPRAPKTNQNHVN